MGNSNALVIYGKDYFESRYYERTSASVKAGTTSQAGMCLVGSGDTNDGRHFICAALGIVPRPPFTAGKVGERGHEEAARIMGVPEGAAGSSCDSHRRKRTAPLETEPEPEPEPTTSTPPESLHQEDVFLPEASDRPNRPS